MKEIYRSMLISRYISITKTASISGPWAQLDLPMLERVFPWSSDEGWFRERTKARQEQTRYRPEYNLFGIFYSWEELRRAPYRFGSKTDSVYPSRLQLQIP